MQRQRHRSLRARSGLDSPGTTCQCHQEQLGSRPECVYAECLCRLASLKVFTLMGSHKSETTSVFWKARPVEGMVLQWVFACLSFNSLKLLYSFSGLPTGPKHVTGLGASPEVVTAGWKDADSVSGDKQGGWRGIKQSQGPSRLSPGGGSMQEV